MERERQQRTQDDKERVSPAVVVVAATAAAPLSAGTSFRTCQIAPGFSSNESTCVAPVLHKSHFLLSNNLGGTM